MQTVVLPTDFSGLARETMQYAAPIFSAHPIHFVLLHSYLAGSSAEALAQEAHVQEQLEKELAYLRAAYPKHTFRGHAQEGDLDRVLSDQVEKNNADLLLMGTRGLQSGKYAFWGTHTSNALQNVACSTLVIPEGSVLSGAQQIVFATDFAGDEPPEALEQLLQIAQRLNARLSVLHILPPQRSAGQDSLSGLRFLHEQKQVPVSVHFTRSQEVMEGILQYIKYHPTDILAVLTRSRSLIERLFHRSITKELVLHSHVPLLALHQKND
ncbi:MAG: universal stress protein [Bernardetiaceae bacterium]